MPTPKNYITSGIGKNFLTPCRRVGLSRSKKTPKNPSPLTPVPNIENNIPNKNVGGTSTDKKTLNFEETPKRTENKSKDNNIVCCEVINTKLVGNKVHETRHTTKNEKKRAIKESPHKNIDHNTYVEVEHHPVAKRSINFNISDKLSAISPTNEQKVVKRSEISAIAEKNIPCSYQVKENPCIEDLDENSFKDVFIKNKKRRIRLDSDDFTSNENLPESINSRKTQGSPNVLVVKKLSKCSNSITESITLSRFTTEDYLKEYSSNPEKFQENLEGDSSVTATIKNDSDIEMEALSNFSKNIKNKKVKNGDTSGSDKKDYVAVVCPSINQSNSKITTKRSLSTKKSSLETKKPLEKMVLPCNFNVQPSTTHNLMVSLERLTKEDLKSECYKDIQFKNLPSNLELNKSTTPTHIKISSLKDDGDDDELFTSSPENDKKQRDNLTTLIINMENEIKQKQNKLEKLKQAQVYKKKHSPEKLNITSDRWLGGCRASLEDLLLKMQEHGPMEMDTLVKKLGIPNDILEKLKL